MKLKFISALSFLMIFFFGNIYAQNQYGLPEEIKQGNILHCFDWKMADVKEELPNIAKAGFVAVQLSPMQRAAANGVNWSDPYRPYDFKFVANGMGNAEDLKALCAEAEKYGIKIIVDVVFNHIDKTPYHDSWWNEGNRYRTDNKKSINYNDRNSITHDQMGDYYDVNTENPDVIARAKAYIEELKSYGVRGIRFDAAKHIGTPSEGSQFWPEVTSVPDMFYYGEILDSPGGINSAALFKEYGSIMSITDNRYSTTARSADGTPATAANLGNSTLDESLLIYWGESHDTWANDPAYGGVTKNTSEATIDRTYAILTSRGTGVGLYLSRPSSSNFGSIRVGQKGSTHFTARPVAEVNKFRNEMVGKAYKYTVSGTVAVVTRQDGGAVIVRRGGSGEIEIANTEGYCPVGTYYDRISGNKFTVTASTISGKVGESGVAVIYGDFVPGPDFEDETQGTEDHSGIFVYCTNPQNWSEVYIYMYSSGGASITNGGWPGMPMTKSGDLWVYEVPSNLINNSRVIFNNNNKGQQYPADTPGEESGYLLNGKSMISNGETWVEYNGSGVDGIIADEEFNFDEAIWFTLQGVQIQRPTDRGLYIAVSPKGLAKKILLP